MAERIEAHLFAEVAQLVRTMVPDGVGEVRIRSHRRGVKVWFDTERPTREHYEAQLLPVKHLADADAARASSGMVLEVGFHSEHSDEPQNQAVADRLAAKTKLWRKELGKPAELDAFYGRDSWRRLSEVWHDIEDLDDEPDAAFEIACRLIDYIAVVEPILAR